MLHKTCLRIPGGLFLGIFFNQRPKLSQHNGSKDEYAAQYLDQSKPFC
jgi:hypothetical protein